MILIWSIEWIEGDKPVRRRLVLSWGLLGGLVVREKAIFAQ